MRNLVPYLRMLCAYHTGRSLTCSNHDYKLYAISFGFWHQKLIHRRKVCEGAAERTSQSLMYLWRPLYIKVGT